MSALTITLPNDLRAWAEQKAASSGTTIHEFVGSLTRQALERAQQEHDAKEAELERLLLEGLNSGEGERVTAQWWQEFRAEMTAELKKQRDASSSP